MDRRLLSIARESDPRFELLLPKEAEAMLLVERQGNDENEVRDQLQQLVGRLQRRKKLAFDSCTTFDEDERGLYWRLARRVIPTLYRLEGSKRPLPFVEDIAVPPDLLPDFLVRVQNIFKTHQVTASLFAHAGHGQLHIRPFLDLANTDDVRRMQELAAAVFEETLAVGGTISGEHGSGLSRTWFLKRQYGPLYDVFREVKRIFDPQNIFNPGKVVADAPQPPTKNLRTVTAQLPLAYLAHHAEKEPSPPHTAEKNDTVPIPLQLVWKPEDVMYAARACNGCGRCRTQSPDERMCPIFRAAPAEEASPRAKANLMRAILSGKLEASNFETDELNRIAHLCVQCHQCRVECPASVDIPKLMAECKSQYVATNGLNSSDWYLSHLHRLSAWGCSFSRITNWAIQNRPMRWVFERLFGIAQGRKLPRLAARPFIQQAGRLRTPRRGRHNERKVLFFVDIYANWHDVDLANSLVNILEHNGVSVFVPADQVASGMNKVALGDVDGARRLAAINIPLLAEAVRQGYHIVASEPSAVLCLIHEYPSLLDDEEARLVAENTSEACTFLWRLHQEGLLELDFRPVHAALTYHQPCHLRALNVGTPGVNLLRLIPGLTVRPIERGCSGMAGTFGLKRENYRMSLRAGWPLISAMRDPSVQVGTTECSACRMQMEQGTSKPTIHPLKILALAYGLRPEFASLLNSSSEELVLS
jgi:Fe-S oxidoreductase